MTKYRSRTHMLLLYPEQDEHLKAFEIIKASYDYVSVLHNRDVTEDGELKKEHLHVIIRFRDGVWSSAICKELGIEERFIEQVKNFDNALLYLLHFNDSDKAQYTIEEVHGSLKKRLAEVINKVTKSEGEKVSDLIDFIESQEDIITVTKFARYCALNGYWAEFRRSGAIFCKMIEEHNYKIQNIKKD